MTAPKRRRFQFRLWTLFALTAIVVLLAALIREAEYPLKFAIMAWGVFWWITVITLAVIGIKKWQKAPRSP